MAQRDFYIDRLRVVLTALVLLHHTAITYGAIGGWFWHELQPSRTPSSILLILFCTTNQAWFMGCFFLFAGYYTPVSLVRKGYWRFILDRLIRLGIPILAFGLLLGPFTAALVTYAQGDGFWPTFVALWHRKEFIIGPLWFAEALLIFSVVYVLRIRIAGPQPGNDGAAKPTPSLVPGWRAWLLCALLVGAGALALRQPFPIGTSLFGYWAIYVVLFVVGIRAKPRNWFAQLTWKQARPWIITASVVWPTLPLAWMLAKGNRQLQYRILLGRLPLCLLGAVHRLGNHRRVAPLVPGSLQPAFSNLGVARATRLRGLHPSSAGAGRNFSSAPWVSCACPGVKFAVVGALTCIATWLLADPLVRLPGVRRVV